MRPQGQRPVGLAARRWVSWGNSPQATTWRRPPRYCYLLFAHCRAVLYCGLYKFRYLKNHYLITFKTESFPLRAATKRLLIFSVFKKSHTSVVQKVSVELPDRNLSNRRHSSVSIETLAVHFAIKLWNMLTWQRGHSKVTRKLPSMLGLLEQRTDLQRSTVTWSFNRFNILRKIRSRF